MTRDDLVYLYRYYSDSGILREGRNFRCGAVSGCEFELDDLLYRVGEYILLV